MLHLTDAIMHKGKERRAVKLGQWKFLLNVPGFLKELPKQLEFKVEVTADLFILHHAYVNDGLTNADPG